MLGQIRWLIFCQPRRVMLNSVPSVVNRLGPMDFSASTRREAGGGGGSGGQADPEGPGEAGSKPALQQPWG